MRSAAATVTAFWLLSAALVAEVLCHVPFLVHAQLGRLRASYASEAADWWQRADWRRRMSYRVAVARIAGVGLAVQGLCASWLLMAGAFSGFFDWCRLLVAGLAGGAP